MDRWLPPRTALSAVALLSLCAAPCAMAVGDSPASAALPTALCHSNVAERTRPFMVGEKRAYFTNLEDGDQVASPFRVAFAVSGMGVSPVQAGLIEGTGHHHILIDLPLPADIKQPIPFDAPGEFAHQHYKHFGGGETETTLNLPPGKHTLRLLFANAQHVPYYVDSQVVNIEVLPPSK